WRSEAGEDATLILHNRIERIRTDAGGTGQNGNGVVLFRAGSVLVQGNRINDCAFSAIRANAASDVQMIGNSCARLGEVALYAEFAFEGAIIANNLVNRAAAGISVTNFGDHGGRLAVVQGNLIRNLSLKKDSEDERGYGIHLEADGVVSNNVIENVPNLGIVLGWGASMRDISATGNLIRSARIGIGLSVDPDAGYGFVSNNMISGAREGGIRAMNHHVPLGPDLAQTSSESYRNIAVYANVSL
ncbi:MAG: TIGR03808 family TAT-translocated repetitive protein, partial [Alphaproteobacteria bacterium]